MRLTSADFVSPGETLDPDAFLDPRDLAELRRLAGLPTLGEDVNSQMGLQSSTQQNPMAPAGDNPWGIKSPVGTTGGNLDKRKIEREKNLIPGTDEWFRLWFSQQDNLTADDFEKNEKLGLDQVQNTLMSTQPDPAATAGTSNESVDPAVAAAKKRKKRTDVNHAIYVITNVLTGEQYIGITACRPTLKKALWVRMQKHAQRARVEDKDWGLCKSLREYGPEAFTFGLLEVVRGKRPAHAREMELIKQYQPSLNTFR
jgi:hypothetical protein